MASHWERKEGTLDHVVIPLMGRLKGDTGIRHHLKSVVNEKD